MNTPQNGMPPAANNDVGALVHLAGRRALPDEGRMQGARLHVHAQWRATVARRRRATWLGLVAAAVACVAVGVWVAALRAFPPPAAIAHVNRITGEVLVRRLGSAEQTPGVPRLAAGDILETSSRGRALLRWLRIADVRIDSGSIVLVESPGELRLMRGAVYVETLSNGEPGDISVKTSAGVIRHVGTQFEVRSERESVRVRVREGTAVFSDSAHQSVSIQAGQQLLVSGGEVSVEPGVPPTDPSWSWTNEIAPAIAIEGRTLFDVLTALGRESGLRIVYEDADVRAKAQAIRLHGRIDGLSINDALKVVLAGSGLAYTLHPDRVDIRSAP